MPVLPSSSLPQANAQPIKEAAKNNLTAIPALMTASTFPMLVLNTERSLLR